MIQINLARVKAIAHEQRRVARSAEFAPLDVLATIPGKAAEAEAARQKVRDKYAAIQTAIDESTTPEQIKAAMPWK